MNSTGRSVYQGLTFKLIIANVLIFVLQIFTLSLQVPYTIEGFGTQPIPAMTYYLGLIPASVVGKGFIWQLFTYMFLHSSTGFVHIFFNMYALLIFGIPIEQAWGGRKFLVYYIFCGVGAGVSIFLINVISGGMGYHIPTIGASGAVFGLLLAFGVLYPNAEILLFFILPIKAKYLVVLYGLLELYFELFGGSSSISHIGHLGGLFFGLVYFYLFRRGALSFKSKMFRARLGKIRTEYSASPNTKAMRAQDSDKEMKLRILAKLRDQGYNSLTDDEVQYVKYLLIMMEGREVSCERYFDAGDSLCAGCEFSDACFVREVERYIKN